MFSVTNPPVRKIGSVADIDPVNEYYGSLTPAMNNNHVSQNQPPPPPATNTGVNFFYFSPVIFFKRFFLLMTKDNIEKHPNIKTFAVQYFLIQN